jgi:raffinose/stachyose/melibiose transport system permease protein
VIDAAIEAPRPGSRARRDRGSPGLPMALPALVLFAAFALVPMVLVFVLGFTTWTGLGTPTWAGLDNWREAATDPVTQGAGWLTLKLMITSWLIQTPLCLFLGVFIAGEQRYRSVLAVFYFVPLLLSTVAIGITFRALLDPNFGMTTAPALEFLARDWLGDSDLAFYSVAAVISWQFIPFHTVLYQAGVRQIPKVLYEAATVDGAGRLAQFWHITLPQLRYTIVTSSMLILVGSLTYFDLVYVMTQGGPGFATRLLPLDMFVSAFSRREMGRASAIASILVAGGLVLSLALVRFSGFARMRSQQEGV